MTARDRARYLEYLKSEHWRTIRRLALEHYDYRCALCNDAGPLQVHHRTYEDGRYGEHLNDLVALCPTCHAKFHGKEK